MTYKKGPSFFKKRGRYVWKQKSVRALPRPSLRRGRGAIGKRLLSNIDCLQSDKIS